MTDTIPEFTKQWINLAQPRLGAEIVSCSDDFFAECSRMLNPEPPQFIVGKFDDNGKWMDGWETRRRRNGGYDHAIIKLGLAGEIKGVDIDTTHFTGNYAPAASLEACYSSAAPDNDSDWQTLISSTSLQGNSHHYFAIDNTTCFTHIRLNLYPDGGVARLRVHGRVVSDAATLDKDALHNLAAVELGAGWVPEMLRRLDWTTRIYSRVDTSIQFDRKPSEQLTEQMGFTPFPIEDVGALIEQSNPDLYLFSSDYPHVEGGRDPIGKFEASLQGADHGVKDKFYAENFLRLWPEARVTG